MRSKVDRNAEHNSRVTGINCIKDFTENNKTHSSSDTTFIFLVAIAKISMIELFILSENIFIYYFYWFQKLRQ